MKLPQIPQPETPKGKRTVRGNIYGNLVGYVSGRRWIEFGDRWSQINQETAEEWRKADQSKVEG